MTGSNELNREGIRLARPRPLALKGERLIHRTRAPPIGRTIGFLVGEERINRDSDLFALSRHDADGVMQERAPDFRGRLRHENARVGLASHQHRQRADMIEMRMRDHDGIELAIAAAEVELGSAGRLLIRESGTEPLVRVMAEGEDEALVTRIVDELCEAIAAVTRVREAAD
jgi:hypothetical protein